MKIVKKVAGIISNQDWKILVFREFSKKREGFFFNIVKWTAEDTDIDFYTTLQREIFEETNLVDAVIGKLFDLVVKIDNDIVNLLLVFEVILEENQSNIGNKNNIADESIKDYTWINKNDFLSMEADNFIDNRIYTVLLKFFSYQK